MVYKIDLTDVLFSIPIRKRIRKTLYSYGTVNNIHKVY